MIKTSKIITLLSLYLIISIQSAFALSGVNPTGVNVRSHGVTTVFLTFQGTAGQTSPQGFWCGEITVPANTVTNTNPCVPGTLFGFLPKRLNLSRNSGTLGASNETDIMTIPSSVSRRAYQDAKAGNNSSFFYVRKFTGPTGDQFVAVTCRMAGGGARVPLALTNVDLVFRTEEGDKPVTLMAQNSVSPNVGAVISYNGSGRLKGRWEIVQPGDPEPTANDLLTEASLPIELRGLQQQYTLLERFNVFLPPTGRAYIQGPKNIKIPTRVRGPYKILLRVEATYDKEGNSNTTTGVTQSGGVAGFSMPVLRYYVASADDVSEAYATAESQGRITLLSPVNNVMYRKGQQVNFMWQPVAGASSYRLEVKDNNTEVLSAALKPNQNSYTTPPWFSQQTGKSLRWRVISKSSGGKVSAASGWRNLTLN
jgi:hypothetical protein